jgi:prepilin-type N-terminal cleavage/methylation domain-containing protein
LLQPIKCSGRTRLKRNRAGKHSATEFEFSRARAGFTLIEALVVMAVGLILTVIAIPVVSQAMTNMRINAAVSQFSGAIASARYQAIKDSQRYTFTLTTPANTYAVKNIVTGATPNGAVPLPSYVTIAAISGSSLTYTLCPNGIVYGAGGVCSPPPATAPPSLSFTYQGRQINVAVSGVGNVTTTTIH